MKLTDRILSYCTTIRKKTFVSTISENPRKILAISTTAIGDTFLSIPAIKALKKVFPESIVELFVNSKFYDLFIKLPYVNNILKLPKSFYHLINTFHYIYHSKFDVAVVFHESSKTLQDLSILGGIPLVINAYEDFDKKEHAIEQRMEAVRFLSCEPLETPRMSFPVSVSDQKIVENYLIGKGVRHSLVLVCPGASRKFKMWPIDKFAILVKSILNSWRDIDVGIIGSYKERRIAEKITKNQTEKSRIFDLSGEIPLPLLPALIKSSKLLVTNDTGPLHVAIAVGTKTVSLFVPTDPNGTGPYQDLDKHMVIKKEKPCDTKCSTKKCPFDPSCMNLIEVREVLNGIEKVMTL